MTSLLEYTDSGCCHVEMRILAVHQCSTAYSRVVCIQYHILHNYNNIMHTLYYYSR